MEINRSARARRRSRPTAIAARGRNRYILADCMKFSARLRLFDYLTFLLSAAVIAGVSVYAYSGQSLPGAVRIDSPKGEWIYPLDRAARVDVPGPLGITEVVIEGGTVRVVDSPCTEKICIKTGPVSATGAWIACLPNRVFVRVEGRSGQDIDATAF